MQVSGVAEYGTYIRTDQGPVCGLNSRRIFGGLLPENLPLLIARQRAAMMEAASSHLASRFQSRLLLLLHRLLARCICPCHFSLVEAG